MKKLAFAHVLLLALSVVGCGDDAPAAAVDGGTAAIDSGSPAVDGGSAAIDSGSPAAVDGGAPTDPVLGTDAGPDAGGRPEVCDNGVDDDRDSLTDCGDVDCWSLVACAAEHVATLDPTLTACHDPIERSVADEDAACAMVGTPKFSEYRTQCAGDVDISATIRFFCNAAMEVRAVWIEERVTVPPATSRMLGPRRSEDTRYGLEGMIDWEVIRSTSGGSAGAPTPLYGSYAGYGSHAGALVTVRLVESAVSIERLIGVAQIISVIDWDTGRSTDSYDRFRVGATVFAIPR